MKIKRLCNEHGQWNNLGREMSVKVDQALRPVLEEAEKKGYSLPDLERIVIHSIGFHTALASLQRQAHQKEKEDARRRRKARL